MRRFDPNEERLELRRLQGDCGIDLRSRGCASDTTALAERQTTWFLENKTPPLV